MGRVVKQSAGVGRKSTKPGAKGAPREEAKRLRAAIAARKPSARSKTQGSRSTTQRSRSATRKPKPSTRLSRKPIHADVRAYNASQADSDQRICDALAKAIHQNLPGNGTRDVEGKIWHRHPVWFMDGNPIVGYHKLKDCIRLLFWSGRSFDEPGLAPEGGFQTAGARYTSVRQLSAKDLKRWLKKSVEIQWDYKNIVKRKGRLERLR